ncbi:DUF2892 domain-containing protein [Stutzerimonas stutzeri]|uniref:YgaP-like transmembrane domain n=1 Tax=Stutzerimonas sp. S1 TaxID=3030652 RepID=UPI0022255273|nr:YgaP-like transmembrane domain [Stutzerimonas sp. S1]MCW3148943.1 DUF2892 domain-containing protein [Stutzerimonas sp. S1]
MNRTSSNAQNVHGWERAASLAGGLYLLGKGLRRGGLGGLLQLAMGGMALSRGVTGRCEAKRIFSEINEQAAMAEGTSRHLPLEQSETDRQRMRRNAEAATATATVTGNQGLETPAGGSTGLG